MFGFNRSLGITPWRTFMYHFRGWRAERQIRPGDIYEDCNYHPVLCTENDAGDVFGISLIDGTGPRGCSMFHCGTIKMTVAEAAERKKNWLEFLKTVPSVDDFWSSSTES